MKGAAGWKGGVSLLPCPLQSLEQSRSCQLLYPSPFLFCSPITSMLQPSLCERERHQDCVPEGSPVALS